MMSRTRLILEMLSPGSYLYATGFLLLFTVMSVSGTGSLAGVMFAVFILFYLQTIHVQRWDAYRALNLTRGTYISHRRALITAAAVLAAVVGACLNTWLRGGFPWPWAVALAGGWIWAVARPPKEPWHEKTRAAEPSSPRSRTRTPLAEIVRIPQVQAWAGYWGGLLAASAVILGINWFRGEGVFATGQPTEQQLVRMMAPVFFIVPAVGLPMLLSSSGGSLRTWVELGGRRSQWTRETLVAGAANAVLGMAAVTALVALTPLRGAQAAQMWLDAAVLAITVPPAFYALALLRGTRTGLVNLFTLGLVVGVWACVVLSVPLPLTFALAVAAFLFWAMSWPTLVRNHVVFNPGLAEWLGLDRARA